MDSFRRNQIPQPAKASQDPLDRNRLRANQFPDWQNTLCSQHVFDLNQKENSLRLNEWVANRYLINCSNIFPKPDRTVFDRCLSHKEP
jgi:hypothetical protein